VILLYRLFLFLYLTGIRLTALWNPKAKAWLKGRRKQFFEGKIPAKTNDCRYWMHCASLGEFEQGRPILEALREREPYCQIILSFFSPSGYEVRKDWPGANFICYLPMDGARSSKKFIDRIQPDVALFVKYEFWHYYMLELQKRSIPSILVSGAFRQDQPFFKAWGGFFRKILSRFTILTVQDKNSLHLLEKIGLAEKSHFTGDTRYDRVTAIVAEAKQIPEVEFYKENKQLIIAGSSWPDDEKLLYAFLPQLPQNWKIVIAPHEINPGSLNRLEKLFEDECIFFSKFQSNSKARVLIIDNYGMLSSLYRYGSIACIGGGFHRSGIHNVLEPAVFGLPVIMGPEYEKFNEAVQMVHRNFAFPVKDEKEFCEKLHILMADPAGLSALQNLIRDFVKERTGATEAILALLPITKQEN
jgi:3-deoxy-D-manno-octulosonic-acid transferase